MIYTSNNSKNITKNIFKHDKLRLIIRHNNNSINLFFCIFNCVYALIEVEKRQHKSINYISIMASCYSSGYCMEYMETTKKGFIMAYKITYKHKETIKQWTDKRSFTEIVTALKKHIEKLKLCQK